MLNIMKKKIVKKLKYEFSVCQTCGGKGRVDPKSPVACPTCQGTGLKK